MSLTTIDVVVKIGGSLSRWRGLGRLLDALAGWRGDARIMVVPGGGPFADLVRLEQRRRGFSESAAHWMAILAMDQYGLLLAALSSSVLPVSSLDAAATACRAGRLPIFLPFSTLRRRDPFAHSWDITSDSIAAYVAGLVGADALLLLKDVDGVYGRDPKRDASATLLRRVPRSRLSRYGCVDPGFGTWVTGVRDCWVINGMKPARVVEWLARGETVGTRVATR
jgi:aspartokinase-like uncharacterized kinase